MFGFRDKNEIANDIKELNEICNEWIENKRMLSACIIQLNIEKITKCKCREKETDIAKLIHCKECKGTGYVIKLKQ